MSIENKNKEGIMLPLVNHKNISSCDNKVLPQKRKIEKSQSNTEQKLKKVKKDRKKKCLICNRKLSIINRYQCRCNQNTNTYFCSLHRYSNEHKCSYDWINYHRNNIKRNNKKVIGEKIIQI